MKASEFGTPSQPEQTGAVSVYCLTALVADEASRGGFLDLARSLESALCGFLMELTQDEQRLALKLSYEMSLGGGEPSPPRLRLAYSRD
jgi:hypothetical protein